MKPGYQICLIIVWAGKLPRYMNLFLHTAGKNAAIDFLIVTDQSRPRHIPNNVRWHQENYDTIAKRFSERLDLSIDKPAPYKLCDFKATFGFVFVDILDGYDFWGHVDCDVVLGDLSVFITDDVLSNNDIIVLRGDEVMHGPLTLYRNNEYVNTLFLKADCWKTVLESDACLRFTETCSRGKRSEPLHPEERIRRGEVPSMTDIVFTELKSGALRVFDQNFISEKGVSNELFLAWMDGTLYDIQGGRALAYYHLIRAKNVWSFYIPTFIPERFLITSRGIHSEKVFAPALDLARVGRGIPRYLKQRAAAVKRRLNV